MKEKKNNPLSVGRRVGGERREMDKRYSTVCIPILFKQTLVFNTTQNPPILITVSPFLFGYQCYFMWGKIHG